MDVDLLFPEAFAFRYSNISAHSVSFGLLSSSAFGNCPLCRKPSSKVHSYYERKVQDLPISGKMVKLSITTRKFFCLEDTCPRKVFAERFGSYLMPHQRRLERSNGQIQAIGLSCGSKPGASVCEVIGLPVSASTILRIMKRTILPEVITPKVLGVDEVDLMLRIIGPCAFKKGHRYGTILVDLEQRRPIDLLPDREGETLQEWLKAHPGVEIITRDRSPVYANAITEACPIATQVADRWHLLKNLSEERYLDTQRPLIRAVAEELNQQQIEQLNSSVNHTSMDPPSKTLNPDTIEAPLTKATPSGKQYQKYEQAKLLQQQGHSRRAIARHLGLSRNTVNKYFRQESYLPRSTKRDSKVLKFEPYLRKRWLEGETCVKTLLEINTLGYTGGYTILTAFLAAYPRVPRADVLPAARKGATLSGRNLSIALCRKEESGMRIKNHS